MKSIYTFLVVSILAIGSLFAQDSVYVYKSNYPVFKESVANIDSVKTMKGNTLLQYYGNSNTLRYSSNISSVDSVTFTPSTTVATPLGMNAYTGLSIGASSNTSIGCYLNAATSRIYPLAGSSAKSDSIDLGVGYSSTTGAVGLFFISPTDITSYILYDAAALGVDRITLWNPRNPTIMRLLDATTFLRANFDAITTGQDILSVFTAASATPVSPNTATKVVSMGIGKSMAFKTIDGKYGVLWVTGVTGSPTASRKIVIDYKVTN